MFYAHNPTPQVVRLKDVFPHGTGFVLVFDFMLSDLSEVIRDARRPLTPVQVKGYMLMLLKGVAFLHQNNIMHRVSAVCGQDLKPANLLISSSGHLKIADFGLARLLSQQEERLYSHQVATRWRPLRPGAFKRRAFLFFYIIISFACVSRWYRAPELLYGARKYDEGVDLWAVGCIFGELLNSSPLFPGENDIEQLCCVLRVLGTPTCDTWPEMAELPDYNKITFKENPAIPLEEMVPDSCPHAISLLYNFLVYPSKRRCPAQQVREERAIVRQTADGLTGRRPRRLSSIRTSSARLFPPTARSCPSLRGAAGATPTRGRRRRLPTSRRTCP
ncbi:cyclin-dependent kinase 20 isoform X4 [Phyllopteryx taeniolatus]|uniref:cyclin-dependent kinase 20 isoform X4 n=1 Tax=Phyllopteryx taeniolatus TaxID=161469 RepID=UPI002AD34435|nr:cyclin-dependent kinase 20 isoform X4 [Phyllopteryx taeniolatus]